MSYLQVQKNRRQQGKEFTYVHLATSVWDARKGHSVQKRVYLGRLEPDSERLVLSKGYPARSGTEVTLTELRKRLDKGEDLEAWLRVPLNVPTQAATVGVQDIPSRVSVVGDAHVLLKLADELKLLSHLEAAFGREDGRVLLGLAVHQAAEGRPIYLAADWLADREVPVEMQKEWVQTDRVYELVARAGMNLTGQEQFFRNWLETMGKPEDLICDITSISTYAANLELAEYGYNRDGDNLPQVNLALVCDGRSGMPIWYRAFPGSIPDVSTLKLTGELLQDLGLQKFRFSLDRGFYSQANVQDMLADGIGFTIGVPFSVQQAKALLPKHRAALASTKRSFPFNDHIMRHVSDAWLVKTGKGRPREIEAHLFLEPSRQGDAQTRLETSVFAIEAKASKKKFIIRSEAIQWLKENARGLTACFSIRTKKDHVEILRQPRAVAIEAARYGYTLVITSEKNQAREKVLADYRGRDLVEKLHDTLKTEDGQRRLRTGNDNSVTGRLFVAFLALALHCTLEKRMRESGILRKMSVAGFLAQMRKVKSVSMASGKRYLLEITKRNRELMAAVGVPLPQ